MEIQKVAMEAPVAKIQLKDNAIKNLKSSRYIRIKMRKKYNFRF